MSTAIAWRRASGQAPYPLPQHNVQAFDHSNAQEGARFGFLAGRCCRSSLQRLPASSLSSSAGRPERPQMFKSLRSCSKAARILGFFSCCPRYASKELFINHFTLFSFPALFDRGRSTVRRALSRFVKQPFGQGSGWHHGASFTFPVVLRCCRQCPARKRLSGATL